MKNEQQNEKINNIIVKVIVSIIGPFLVFIISNYFNAIYSLSPKEALVISFIIMLMGIICWLIIRMKLKSLFVARIEGRKIGLLSKNNKINSDICHNEESSLYSILVCPLIMGFSKYSLPLKINKAISDKFRLFDKENVYELEKKGNIDASNNNTSWQDIWIFSQDLSSEIDPSTNKAEPVLVANITNYKTKYTMFYLGLENQKSIIERRKISLRENLPNEEDKKLLSFIPIDVKSGFVGKNTLPLLCGAILFSQNRGNDEMPIFLDGYLSLRKDKMKDPIYYKMPKCMLKKYAEYFEQIYKRFN